jgi:hypothetical protein
MFLYIYIYIYLNNLLLNCLLLLGKPKKNYKVYITH